MARQENARPALLAEGPAGGTHGPRWRSILEDRWQARLAEVTELSLAYHAVSAIADTRAGQAAPEADAHARRLLRRTVTARRKLADVEEALTRLSAGRFGYCEQCGSAIPATLLTVLPEARYCPLCSGEPAPDGRARRVQDAQRAGPLVAGRGR